MVAPVGETSHPSGRPAVSPRSILIWAGLAAAVIALFFVAVAVLNSTVYSASGFVKSYVSAIDRGDTSSALSLAGVQATGVSGDELLTVSEKGSLHAVQVVSDTTAGSGGGGSRRVTIGFDTIDGGTTTPHTTVFTVRPAGTFGALFDRWEFSAPPTASLDITPLHDPRFTANGSDVTTKSADLATRYTVLAPAVFTLSHDTTYLTADRVQASVDAVGGVQAVSVDVEPRASFVDKVRTDVTKYLRSDCLPQKVLLPSGCPFGQQIDDRLTSTPKWSMTRYPAVILRPTATAGVWQVASAAGRAHLEVGAESLYDGHDYTVDEDVPFTVAYQVAIGADNGLTITPK